MTVFEHIRARVLKLLGLVKYDKAPDADRLTFINDSEQVAKMKLREYNVWYDGDGDELLNFYTKSNLIDFNYEPFYMRNKKNYFWAISSKEAQIKRTHSGQPRNIVDTLVNIMPFPMIGIGDDGDEAELNRLIDESGIKRAYKEEQLPLTLVEGWGCWKINWDKDVSDYPMATYYRAENVDFVYKSGKIIGCIFKDYYTTDKKRYMLVETRHLQYNERARARVLVIDNELFEMPSSGTSSDSALTKVELAAVPELKDVEPRIEIGPFDRLFAVPCILLGNTSQQGGYGRSIFTGKIDLFDDLDQALSQASNAVRLSTPIEYFNSEFLERDKNGMPKKPTSYDRKYVMVEGQKNADGVSVGEPIQITQPNLDFSRYSDHAVQILLQILNGILSPATLGIDIAKKDNAAAQREKEKVTIFTRNGLIDGETEILKSLLEQLLMAKEFMDTGAIVNRAGGGVKYNISIKFNEFADDSFENKLDVLGKAYDMEEISPDMYIEKLYGDSLSRAEKDKELEFLNESRAARQDAYANAGGDGENIQGMIDNKFRPEEGEDRG